MQHFHLLAILAALAPIPGFANTAVKALCVAPVAFQTAPPAPPFRLNTVVQSDLAENDIFALGDPEKKNIVTGFIRHNQFIPLKAPRPSPGQLTWVYPTGSGELIGIFGVRDQKEFWRQDPETGEFTRQMQIKNLIDEGRNIRKAGWSSPMNALLLARDIRNEIFAIEDHEMRAVDVMRQSPKHHDRISTILDIPEINMTFLATEEENRVYLIDATQHVHDLGAFAPEPWVFVKDVVLLTYPYRLLIDMQEALGPFKGRFIIRLEERGGVWGPAREQDFRNVYTDFDQMSDPDLDGVDPDRLMGLSGFKTQFTTEVPGPGQTKLRHNRSVAIYLPNSDAYVSIGDEQIQAFDISSGDELRIIGAQIKVSKYFPWSDAAYLPDRDAILVAAENGYFILKDAVVDDVSACR